MMLMELDFLSIGTAGYNDFLNDQTTIGCEDMTCSIGTAGDCEAAYSGDEIWIDLVSGG